MGFLAKLGAAGIANLFTRLWPVAVALIQTAQELFPGEHQGETKFNHVVSEISTFAYATPEIVQAVEASGADLRDGVHKADAALLTQGIGRVVQLAVDLAKAAGVLPGAPTNLQPPAANVQAPAATSSAAIASSSMSASTTTRSELAADPHPVDVALANLGVALKAAFTPPEAVD